MEEQIINNEKPTELDWVVFEREGVRICSGTESGVLVKGHESRQSSLLNIFNLKSVKKKKKTNREALSSRKKFGPKIKSEVIRMWADFKTINQKPGEGDRKKSGEITTDLQMILTKKLGS